MAHGIHELIFYEQRVNNRFGTSPGNSIPDFMRPENEEELQLAWYRAPVAAAEVFVEQPFDEATVRKELLRDDHLLFPVHPLEESKLKPGDIVRSGHIRFSASYRTVFYRPEPDGPLSSIHKPGLCTMLKLNLEHSLPGIPGDRRLSRDTVQRCVLLGNILERELSRLCPGSVLRIITEPIGIFVDDAGTLVRPVPDQGIVPLFSLYSADPTCPDNFSLIDVEMRRRFGDKSLDCAMQFGEEVGAPLIKALLDGFRCGFSLEMHAQNTLVSVGAKRLIDKVFFRDLEGALVSNPLRTRLGLDPVLLPGGNVFGGQDDFPIGHFFNRNLDHDVGRVFRGCISALRTSGYFSEKDGHIAVKSIRSVVRKALADADLPIPQASGTLAPFSRAPWGSGLRPGHWFRTEFR